MFRKWRTQPGIQSRASSSDHRSNGAGVRGPACRHRRGALWGPVYVRLGPENATEGAGERATLRTGMDRGLVTVVTAAPAHLSALPCPSVSCGLSPRLADTACWAGRSTCWGMRCGPMRRAAPFVVVSLTAVMRQVRCCADRSSWFASCRTCPLPPANRHYGGGEWCGGCCYRTCFRPQRLGTRGRYVGTTSGSVRGGSNHYNPSARLIWSLKIAILEPFF